MEFVWNLRGCSAERRWMPGQARHDKGNRGRGQSCSALILLFSLKIICKLPILILRAV